MCHISHHARVFRMDVMRSGDDVIRLSPGMTTFPPAYALDRTLDMFSQKT